MTGQDLASVLREIPVPPTRITTEQAISLGRKAVRRRRHGIAAGAAAAVVAATAGGFTLAQPAHPPGPLTLPSASPSASPSAAPVSAWTPTRLPLPSGVPGVWVNAMDASGRYIAGTADSQAVVWENLSPRLLPRPPAPFNDLMTTGVNSSGVVIGTAAGYSWVFRDGATRKLPAPRAGGRYNANAINDRGDILGWSERSGPILWPASSPDAAPRVVSNVESAYTIGNDGSIGGTLNDGDHPVVVSPDGKARRLAELPGKPGGKVFAIQGDWAVGWVPANTDSNLMSARWNLVTGELTPFPRVASIPKGVAADGTFVAYLVTLGPAAVIMPDGTILGLPPLPDLPVPSHLPPGFGIAIEVVGISSDATIVAGNNRVPTGTSNVATIWRRTG